MRRTRAAGVTAAAAHVALAANEVADGHPLDVGGDLGDRTPELMANDPRGHNAGAGPRIPGVDMQVRPADPPGKHLDEDFASPGPGDGRVGEFQPRSAVWLEQRLHPHQRDLRTGGVPSLPARRLGAR